MAVVEYRSVIKFYFLLGKSADETLNDMKIAYKEHCPSKATLYYWLRQFKSGREDVHDEKSLGRPTEISDDKSRMCEKAIRENRRIKMEELANVMNISKGSAVSIVASLGYRKLSSRFVPIFLSPEMKDARLAQENLTLFE